MVLDFGDNDVVLDMCCMEADWWVAVVVVGMCYAYGELQKIIIGQHFLLVYFCSTWWKHSMYRGRCLSSSVGRCYGYGSAIEVWMKVKTRKRQEDRLLPKRLLCLLFWCCVNVYSCGLLLFSGNIHTL